MAEFFFRAFGTPGIDGPDGPLGAPATQRRTLALLAIVSTAGSAGVRREKLLDLLWPDSDSERARHALTQALYQARRSVGGELFVTSGDYIQLDPGTITSDVAAFEEALARHDVDRLLTIYTGPFLEGFVLSPSAEFERWVSGQRAHFAERVGRAIGAAAGRAEADQDWPGAVRWLKQLAALEPVRGSVAVRLMRAMAATGDRAGAIRHAQIYTAIVAAELDAPPDPAVRELEEQLRVGAPDVAESAPPSPAPPLARSFEGGTAVPSVVTPSVRLAVLPAAAGGPQPVVETLPELRVEEPPGGRRRHVSRYWWALLAAVVLIFAVLGWHATHRTPSEAQAPRSDVLVVLPFRVTGGGKTASYLSEGLMDLLITTLPDVTPAMAVDPGVLVRAWHDAGGTPTNTLTLPQALQIARIFRGTHLVSGNAIVAGKRLVVTGWLANVATGRIEAQTTVEGASDSLTALVDRLGARLVAVSAGQSALLADRALGSARDVRTYLAGLRAYRAGQFSTAARRFESILVTDTSFAEAAFWLMLAGDRGDVAGRRARGLRLAWAARDALSEADRAYLIAFAGPRYPNPSSDREHLRAWASVVGSWPERADAWQELGEVLFHDGAMLGIRDAREQARRAFSRARVLAPDFALPLPYLVQIAALDRDQGALDALAPAVAADSSELGDFARWQLAVVRGDEPAVRRMRTHFTHMPLPSLRTIAMAAQYEHLGDADVLASAEMLARRTIGPDAHADALLALHSAALLQRRPTLVRQALDDLDDLVPDVARRLRVTDAIYASGDTAAAAAAVRQLRRRNLLATALRGGRQTAELRRMKRSALDACVAAQWSALHDAGHAADTLRRTATQLRTMAPLMDDAAVSACQALIAATAGHANRCRNDMLAPLDSLIHDGAPVGEVGAYLPVATARLHRACGDPSTAMAVAQMRAYMREWPMYAGDD